MQLVYICGADVQRAERIEYEARKSRVIPGRIGLSLVLRTGLKLLADEFAKNEQRTISLMAAIAEEGA